MRFLRHLKTLTLVGVLAAMIAGACSSDAPPAEAEAMLKLLYQRARTYYEVSGQRSLPPSSPSAVPALGSCCAQGGECAPNSELWARPPWNHLLFNMEEPFQFSYRFLAWGNCASGECAISVQAYGDLDCDGEFSTFTTYGEVVRGAPNFPSEPPIIQRGGSD